MKVDVSVVIPCRNEVKHIRACLAGILAQDPPDGGFEVIIADGMSDDGTRDIVQEIAAADPRLRMVDNPPRTTPAGLNAGIRSARGSIVVRVDAHTEYAQDYVKRCVETLRETGADNVGGPWVARGTTYLQRAIAAAFQSPFAVGGARGHCATHEGSVDTVYLGCWNRELFDRIGLFDEDLIRNQDDELNLRLKRAGGEIWQSPSIVSWYTPRGSLVDLFRQYWQYGYWKPRVIRKHRVPASVRHLIPGSFVAALILLAVLAPFLPVAGIALISLVGVYVAALLFASIHIASRSESAFLPVLPIILACFHIGYGAGFLAGACDFLLLRRNSGRFVAITRR